MSPLRHAFVSVAIGRYLLLASVVLLAGLVTDSLAATAIVTFDEGTIPPDLECNVIWFEGDVGLRVVPTPLETCGLALCVFSHSSGALGLSVAQLRADLSLIVGTVDSVEVTFSTVCFDCADISVFNGNELVATTTNGPNTFGTVTLDVGGVHVDRLEVNPCIDFLLSEIVVYFEPDAASVAHHDAVLPNRQASLGAMHPNPFSRSTSIHIAVAESGHADLRVYDASGRRVRHLVDADLDAGRHRVIWDGLNDEARPVTYGAYFLQLRFHGVVVDTRKVILLP